ncbi:MAG: hypothetical protein WKF92_12615 [Pyrinomonadaceae bacterium]
MEKAETQAVARVFNVELIQPRRNTLITGHVSAFAAADSHALKCVAMFRVKRGTIAGRKYLKSEIFLDS